MVETLTGRSVLVNQENLEGKIKYLVPLVVYIDKVGSMNLRNPSAARNRGVVEISRAKEDKYKYL